MKKSPAPVQRYLTVEPNHEQEMYIKLMTGLVEFFGSFVDLKTKEALNNDIKVARQQVSRHNILCVCVLVHPFFDPWDELYACRGGAMS